MSGLKDCPLCGSDQILEIQKGQNSFEIRCVNCGLNLNGKVLRKTIDWLKQNLTERWNNRVAKEEDSLQESVKELRDLLEDKTKLILKLQKEVKDFDSQYLKLVSEKQELEKRIGSKQ